MRKEEKVQIIDSLTAVLKETPNFYVTDIEGLNAENTSELRRACFENNIKLMVVKNTLLVKVLEKMEGDAAQIIPLMKGPSALMLCEAPNAPAKLIKEFSAKMSKPVLKGALVQDCAYIGAENLETLVNIKWRHYRSTSITC